MKKIIAILLLTLFIQDFNFAQRHHELNFRPFSSEGKFICSNDSIYKVSIINLEYSDYPLINLENPDYLLQYHEATNAISKKLIRFYAYFLGLGWLERTFTIKIEKNISDTLNINMMIKIIGANVDMTIDSIPFMKGNYEINIKQLIKQLEIKNGDITPKKWIRKEENTE